MRAQKAIFTKFAPPLVAVVVGLGALAGASVTSAAPEEVTFTKDITPILQRSCQNCHRPMAGAPMSLITYDEVRPWARAIKMRTGWGPRAGVMPPWYIEKDIGVQEFKNDVSLTPEEIAAIAKWADTGAPLGNPADMPPPRQFGEANAWSIGEPDLIVSSQEVMVKADAPDWWGSLAMVETGLPDDRYVAAIEMKEVNDIPSNATGRATVGASFVIHHLAFFDLAPGEEPTSARLLDTTTLWPVHEVGRNVDIFDASAGRLLKAGSRIVIPSVHLHSNGRDTKSRLLFGFKLHPKGYQPTTKLLRRGLANGVDIDIRANKANQQLHAYTVLQEHTKITSFEPHLHAPGARMCLEAIWGINIQTLSCAGYDHSWVRVYEYADDAAPILPKGTILHIVGYMDTTAANKNVTDPRNWSGSGNRSIANMFLDLGQQVSLTEEQFREEMARRREKMRRTGRDYIIGCPLCNVAPDTNAATETTASR
jgi:hypothetical protein